MISNIWQQLTDQMVMVNRYQEAIEEQEQPIALLSGNLQHRDNQI